MDEQQTVVELPCFGIKVTLEGSKDPFGWDSGTIESDLREVCHYCNNPQCNMDCDRFLEHKSDRDAEIQKEKEQEAIAFREYRIAVDVIDSIVLAHAISGINVEDPAYINGIETACYAIVNNT